MLLKSMLATVSAVALSSTGLAATGKSLGVYGGVGFIPRMVMGGGVFAQLGSNIQTDVEFFTGDYSISIGDSKLASDRKHIAARGRYFFSEGGSFNGFGALAYDTLDYTANAGGFYNFKYENAQLELELGIGNRWIMDSGFTIGVDWIGYGLPITNLSKKVTATNLDSTASSAEILADNASDAKKNAEAGSLHFLRLGLGWAF